MIEAAEYATPYQRKLHDQYQQISQKFAAAVEPPTAPRWRDMVRHRLPTPTPPVPEEKPAKPVGIEETITRMKIIRRVVCETYCINREALLSARRTNAVVFPRHVYIYLASRLTKASLPQIGKSVGGQDHTTILHAIRRMNVRLRSNPAIAARVEALETRIKTEFGISARPKYFYGKYVPHHQVEDHERLGWLWRCVHNEYAAIMIWPCGCNCVEPKT